MKRHHLFGFILLLLLFAACENRPKDVLSRGKMEDVLYDYHLMQGVIDQLPTSEERLEKAQDYINSVYAKHGITEEQFDSSIVYYNRHPKDLHKIYTHLKERYTSINEEVQIVNGNNDMMAIYATGGDTTNLWSSARTLALHSKELLSHESFTIHADTSFRRNDQFILTLTPLFIREDVSTYDIMLSVGLGVCYTDGKTAGVSRVITSNGTQQLTLQTDATKDIKSITGFFQYQGKKTIRNLCLIDDISLVRMHEKPKETVEEPTDSLPEDTTKEDSATQEVKRRLSPEEIRLQNRTGEQIKIQKAPSVRTPNSIGPRRRKPQRK